MIPLFNTPTHKIDTRYFSNMLHDKKVKQFEEQFCEFVGAKYAVSLNSATSVIFLLFNQIADEFETTVEIPSILPPVVANAIINAGCSISFTDNINWVGNSYILKNFDGNKIIDSAQKCERDQFKKEANDSDLMLFSFYPTKPVSGCDGGMIVSNNGELIEFIRELANNGMSQATNNWDRTINMIGHKMYMNSIQAYIALRNLQILEEKQQRISAIRELYNKEFELANKSSHLFTIRVKNNRQFIEQMKQDGITCGIHYTALHLNKLYSQGKKYDLPLSEQVSQQTVSIPMHEALRSKEISYIIEKVKKYASIAETSVA